MKKTLVIGEREVAIMLFALGALMVAAFVLTLGIVRFNQRGGELAAVTVTATPAVVPTEAAPDAEAQSAQPTPVLAPTMAPTIEQIIHTVQPGETLLGIATRYNVNVQTILNANALTMDSVVQPGQTLVVPLVPDEKGTWHEVGPGENLTTIAADYGTTPEEIQQANGLSDVNAIYVGQRLYIPLGRAAEPDDHGSSQQALPADDPLLTEGPLMSDWPRSIYQGDLATNYPLTYEHDRFTLHYQPGTYPDLHLEETVALVTDALARVEDRLDVRLEGTFDIYVAGTLFAAPDASLRGRSFSLDRRTFFLHDGGGNPADNAYIVTHELTHLVSWNTWGAPSSVMLSEGLATYSGQEVLEEGGFMDYDQLCLAAYAAGEMASMSVIEKDFQSFLGHNRHRFNYFGSACFVGRLIDEYGLESLSKLYHTSDYVNIYGKTLAELDADWQADLAARQSELTADPVALVDYTKEWTDTSDYVFKNYNGTVEMHRAYAAVDRARVALWQANYDEVRRWLDEVYAITGYAP